MDDEGIVTRLRQIEENHLEHDPDITIARLLRLFVDLIDDEEIAEIAERLVATCADDAFMHARGAIDFE